MALEIDLSGRVALVTGGSRGLGRADALTLARAGADVVIADLLVESELSEETDAYGPLARSPARRGSSAPSRRPRRSARMGRRSLAVRCDVTDRDQVAAAVARTVDELGSVDILVNNAGHARPRRPVRRPEPGALGARPPRQPDRGVQLRAGGVAAHEGAEVGPHREHGLRRRHARRLRPGVVLDDEGGSPRPDEDARHGGRPPRDHRERDRARDHRHRGVPHGESGDERADREPHRLQAPGRAAGHRERDRLPLLRPRRLHHRASS